MKYMGSKARIAEALVEIIIPKGFKGVYLEPFAGGMNMMQAVPATVQRFANDSNKYIIAMFEALASGWVPPQEVSREYYYQCKRGECEDHVRGYVGINCSYCGKWFDGYAGIATTAAGTRNYPAEGYRHMLSQIPKLTGVAYSSKDYRDLVIPKDSIVYCDAPYEGTRSYSKKFDHTVYWNWVREISTSANVFVSEYKAPADFECLWAKKLSSTLSVNGGFWE